MRTTYKDKIKNMFNVYELNPDEKSAIEHYSQKESVAIGAVYDLLCLMRKVVELDNVKTN